MFDVKVQRTRYNVNFRHVKTESGEIVTFCTITNKNGLESTGYAISSHNFNRNKNRKEALADALQGRVDRSYRKQFWMEYFNARHGAY